MAVQFQTLKNAPRTKSTVTLTPTAPTPKDHSTARVIRGTLGMELFARVRFEYFLVFPPVERILLKVLEDILSKSLIFVKHKKNEEHRTSTFQVSPHGARR